MTPNITLFALSTVAVAACSVDEPLPGGQSDGAGLVDRWADLAQIGDDEPDMLNLADLLPSDGRSPSDLASELPIVAFGVVPSVIGGLAAGRSVKLVAIGFHQDGTWSDVTKDSMWGFCTPGPDCTPLWPCANGTCQDNNGCCALEAPSTVTALRTDCSCGGMAIFSGMRSSFDVSALPAGVALVAVIIDPPQLTLRPGGTQSPGFRSFETRQDGMGKLTTVAAGMIWSSSDETTVRVLPSDDLKGANVYALQPGTAIVTAATPGGEASTTAKVVVASPTSLDVSPISSTIAIGEQAILVATAQFPNGDKTDVTGNSMWTSARPAIAAVTGGGVVAGVAKGSTMMTAVYGGKTATSTVSVGP